MSRKILLLALLFLVLILPSAHHATSAYQERGPISIRSDADLTPENGVVGGSGTSEDPFVIEGWRINGTLSLFGIELRSVSKYVVVRNCLIFSNSSDCDCVVLHNASHITLENCVIEGGRCAVLVKDSRVTLLNCTLRKSAYGVSGTGSQVEIRNCFIESEAGGIVLSSCNGTVRACDVRAGDGIVGEKCEGLVVEDCQVRASSDGIRLSGNSSTVKNVDVRGCSRGIVVWDQREGGVSNCTVQNCTYGISLSYGSFGVSVEDCEVLECDVGILLEYSTSCAVRSNNVTGCGVGISLAWANFSAIYDNFFFNGRNWEISGLCVGNDWNVSRVTGENIIGGPMGGNYWSDYAGEDLDGDGIGDTALPYGPGDWRPLTSFIRITEPLSGASYYPEERITVRWECSKNVVRVELRLDDSPWQAVEGGSYELPALSEGVHTVQVRGFDSAGKVCTDYASFLVWKERPSFVEKVLPRLTSVEFLLFVVDIAVLISLPFVLRKKRFG